MARRSKVVNNLPAMVEGKQRTVVSLVSQALVRVGSELAVLVPIDTSNLINSQFRHVEQDGPRVTGTIGFTAEYAAAVHEAEGKLKGQPRPKRDGRERGRFWGPHEGQPGFLEVAVERAEPEVTAMFARGL